VREAARESGRRSAGDVLERQLAAPRSITKSEEGSECIAPLFRSVPFPAPHGPVDSAGARVSTDFRNSDLPALYHDDMRKYVLTCARSEEHTSELQSRENLGCRLL